MLQRKPDSPKLKSFGFLVGVEIEEGATTTEKVSLLLADALSWHEGVGAVEVECLGQIDVVEEEPDAT